MQTVCPEALEVQSGIVVERRAANYEDALDRISRHPMEAYSYVDGRILHDPEEKLARLREVARDRFATYRTPAEKQETIAYWLKSSLIKIEIAR